MKYQNELMSYFFFLTPFKNKYNVSVNQTLALLKPLIGESKFFKLSVAVAIGLFGLQSPAALVCVVGVLVEVPVMLSLVAYANKQKY